MVDQRVNKWIDCAVEHDDGVNNRKYDGTELKVGCFLDGVKYYIWEPSDTKYGTDCYNH